MAGRTGFIMRGRTELKSRIEEATPITMFKTSFLQFGLGCMFAYLQIKVNNFI